MSAAFLWEADAPLFYHDICRLLQDPDSRKLFLDIVYDLLKGDHAQELLRELHDNQDQNCTD